MSKTLDPTNSYQLETLAIRAGTHRTEFNEHSEALFLTSSFVFDSAAQAAARFIGQEPGYTYSRFTNPTVTMFEERLAALEGAEQCVATSSGMSAVLACVMGHLKAGDHIVASQSVFGSIINLFNNVIKKFGVETTYVSATDVAEWKAAVRPNTRMFFLETPSNPLTEVADMAAIAAVAKSCASLLVVDNCFCTPILQRPLEFGADIVIHSATKYLDGQGRVLGGAVLGSKKNMESVYQFLRITGPTMSAFNAWVFLKGMETLKIRMDAHSANALQLAQWLEKQPNVARVYYPGLPSHPQHKLAMKQQKTGGGIVAFEVKGGKEAAWRVIDNTKMLSITANLGDTRTTITHPASTTHARITPEARAAAGITDGVIRIGVGLEAVIDIQADLARGLQ